MARTTRIMAFLLGAMGGSAGVSAEIRDNLLIYLPYDETSGVVTHDMSGNGFDGVLFFANASQDGYWSSPMSNTHWVPGKFGNGLALYDINFDGMKVMDTHVMYEDFVSGDERNWTYSFWVRRPVDRNIGWGTTYVNQWTLDETEGYTAGDEYSVDWWNWEGGLEYDMIHTRVDQWINGGIEDGDRVLTSLFSAGGGWEKHNINRFNENPGAATDPELVGWGDGEWHNIILAVEGNPQAGSPDGPPGVERFTLTVYIDGIAAYERIDEGGEGWGTMSMEAFTVSCSEELKGIDNNDEFDDVAVWNRILTPGEIAFLQTHPVLGVRPDCGYPRGDTDDDGDVDQDDFAVFQACLTGDGGVWEAEVCACFDADKDNDVDSWDYQQFEICASGPDVPADPVCGEPVEACCLPGGVCEDRVLRFCVEDGGIPRGEGTECATVECPQSCCLPGGVCQDLLVDECTGAGGVPGGAGTDCDTTSCVEACCLDGDVCQNLTYEGCIAADGSPKGPGTDCATSDCTQSCCLPDGSCMDLTAADCIAQNGAPGGVGSSCDTTGCPVACCLPNGTCDDLRADVCQTRGGRASDPGTSCATDPCTRACCFGDNSCADLTPSQCVMQGGTPQAVLSECSTTVCGE